MMSRDPVVIAKNLGLDFDTVQTRDGRWVRFTFRVPQAKDNLGPGGVSPAQIDRSNAPKQPQEFHDAVERITRWRQQVKPWIIWEPTNENTVATKLNPFTRMTVAKYNRKNHRKIKRLATNEEEARRIAQTQPTPHQGIVVLDSLTELKEHATRELRERFIARCAAIGQPWEGKPTPMSPVKVAPLRERLMRFAPHAVAAALLLALIGAVIWAFS